MSAFTNTSDFKLIHLGGENTVTGSCHLLQVGKTNILIDCGANQGDDHSPPMDKWPVSPADIDFLFLTHSHIDHIGRVPELIKNGFSGEIICTHATKALIGPMLEDALHFESWSRDEKEQLLSDVDDLSWGFEFLESFRLRKGIGFKLGRAGHILGSCWVRLEMDGGKTIVFSGDLGSRDTPILRDPDIPDPCDLLVLESTYGDRRHEGRAKRIEILGGILDKVLEDKGKVLIPAFSLGRTQELIYEMDRLHATRQFPGMAQNDPIPVFIDSPLGLEITRIYSALSQFWDREARDQLYEGDHPLDFANLYAVENHESHLKLLDLEKPAIIIAGSGMCTGGRIINHLKKGLSNPATDILFVGYQAQGTTGRNILRYAFKENGYAVIDGERYPIRARVHQLNGYSAHADSEALLQWALAAGPKMVKLVHGESHAKKSLKNELLKNTTGVLD